MNKEFRHLRFYTAVIAVIFSGTFSLLIVYVPGVNSLPAAFLSNPLFLLSLLMLIYYSDKIILTEMGIIKKNLFLKQYLSYEDIIDIEETISCVVLIGKKNRISIKRQMASFSEFYGLLLQGMPVLGAAGNITFPFKMKSRTGDNREFIFDSDAIIMTTPDKCLHWEIAQLRKIEFQRTYHEIKGRGGRRKLSPDDYYASNRLTLSFYTGYEFTLDSGQLEHFGYSPERLALTLRQLYPDKFYSNVYGRLVDETSQKRDRAEAHLVWGDKLRQRGQYERAIDEYAAAIDLNPEYSAHKYEIGNLFFELERYDEAAIAYRKMLTYFPDHGPSTERLELCLFLSGQNNEFDLGGRG